MTTNWEQARQEQTEKETIDWFIDIINQMKDEGNYHNPTLDELEDRLQQC